MGGMLVSEETVKGYKLTLRATWEISNAFNNECAHACFMTVTISQDPLERFFSGMRFSCNWTDHLLRVNLLKTLLETKESTRQIHESKRSWLESIDSALDSEEAANTSSPHEDEHAYNKAITSEVVQSCIVIYIGRELKKMLKCENYS